MIPETVPVWAVPAAWIASAVGFFTLASIQNRNRWLWGVVGLVLPLAAIVAYPLTSLTRSDRADMDSIKSEIGVSELETHRKRVKHLAYLIAAVINVSWLAFLWGNAFKTPSVGFPFGNTTIYATSPWIAAFQTLFSIVVWTLILFGVEGDG